MKYAVLPADATDEQIVAMIQDLRRRQRLAVIPSTGVELGDDIDELLELLPKGTSPGGAIVPMDPGTPAAGRGRGAGRDAAGSSGLH